MNTTTIGAVDTAPAPIAKFGLLVDLGIITVPANYVPVTMFSGMSFANPTWILMPGQEVWVRAHKQTALDTTTSEERLAYLAMLQSYLVGAQGIALVEPYGDQLPEHYSYASLDEAERLPLDFKQQHRFPAVLRGPSSKFRHALGIFEEKWFPRAAFFSCCEPGLRSAAP